MSVTSINTMQKEDMTTVGYTLDIEKITQLLPHRLPMLMVDRVVNVQPGESADGIKNVTANEWFFQGHFPAAPVFPGVLIIEAMAQTAAVIVMDFLGESAHGKIVYFMSVDEARFRKPVKPGDQLVMTLEKLRSRGPVWKFKGVAKVDGEVVAESVLTAMIAEEGKE